MDESSQSPQSGSSRSLLTNKWSSLKRRLLQVLAIATCLLLALIVWAWVNNNYSFTNKSAAEISTDLDQAIDLGIGWIVEHREEFENAKGNSALLHMIGDMSQPVATPKLQEIFANHLTQRSPKNFWRRMLEPVSDTNVLSKWQLAKYAEYQRWLAYAIAPSEIKLSDEDFKSMLSPDKNTYRHLTHQLMALDMLRDRNEGEEDFDDLIDTLCQRIARECAVDFRVTDLYLQRVAVVLAADRPDLIKKRWVERIIANQDAGGGFHYSWYGWQPNPLKLFDSRKPVAHATVQGVWLLYMIRHRFPDWITENLPA